MLVDDHANFRRPLTALLHRQPDLEVIAQTGSLAEARTHAAAVKFVVAVLGLGLPDGNGADLIAVLRRVKTSVAVLVLSASLNPKNLEKATEAGADVILDKFVTPGEFLGAIRHIGIRGAADTV
jgi:DNA-binding NarL/FixJ family response regulator